MVSSLTTKTRDRLLARIRSRTEGAADANAADHPEGAAAGPVSLREAQFADFAAVSAMNRGLGQGADSLENWHRLWRDNPALRHGRASRIGWLLESQGRVVGFLGSIPLQYAFQGVQLAAAATCRLAVEPAYRSSTPLLVTSFFRQKDVDLFLNTTATPAAGKIVAALRALQVPQPDYGKVLFWVLRPQKFARAVLRKMGLGSSLAMIGSAGGGLALGGDRLVRGRTPRASAKEYSVKAVSFTEIGAEFEDFWAKRQATGLYAKRSGELFRWHFQPPGSTKVAELLAADSSQGLAGYLVVRHEPRTADGLQRSAIADLMVDDDPGIQDALLAAAHRSAKEAGSDTLEAMGFPARIRAGFLKWRPYSRDYPACPYFYKARERGLHGQLASPEVWYACPYDGDSTLWP
jgi:hypothetical protein